MKVHRKYKIFMVYLSFHNHYKWQTYLGSIWWITAWTKHFSELCVHVEQKGCWKHTYLSVAALQERVRAHSKMFPLHLHCSVILALTPGWKQELGSGNNRLTLPWRYFLLMGQMLFCCWLRYTSPSSKEGTRVAMFSNPAVFPGTQLHRHTGVNSKWLFHGQGLVRTDHFKWSSHTSSSPAHHLCTHSHVTLARFLLSPLFFSSFLYILFSLMPHCGASSSSHASVFLAAQEAAYALSGSELRVCCPLCQSSHGAPTGEEGSATLSSPPLGHFLSSLYQAPAFFDPCRN